MDITVRAAMTLRNELDLMLLRHDGSNSDHLGLTPLAQAILIDVLQQSIADQNDDQLGG